jgi:hypothetical protein
MPQQVVHTVPIRLYRAKEHKQHRNSHPVSRFSCQYIALQKSWMTEVRFPTWIFLFAIKLRQGLWPICLHSYPLGAYQKLFSRSIHCRGSECPQICLPSLPVFIDLNEVQRCPSPSSQLSAVSVIPNTKHPENS